MIPNSRATFQTYCLQKLGFPAVQINVNQDQIDDRIDDALLFFRNYHDDAVQEMYLKHQVTDADVDHQYIDLNQGGGTVTTIAGSNTVIGTQTSFTTDLSAGYNNIKVGNEAYPVVAVANSEFITVAGPFLNNNNTAPYYIPEAAASIVSVSGIFSITSTSSQTSMFDLRYQLRLHELYDFTSTSYINFVLTQQQLRTLDMLFTGDNPFRFNMHTGKLYVDWNWGTTIQVGEYMVMKCQKALDPNLYPQLWNDQFLKAYAAALIKKQWGANMSKYQRVQLPGGYFVDGKTLYNEADAEIKDLEDNVINKWSMLSPFLTG